MAWAQYSHGRTHGGHLDLFCVPQARFYERSLMVESGFRRSPGQVAGRAQWLSTWGRSSFRSHYAAEAAAEAEARPRTASSAASIRPSDDAFFPRGVGGSSSSHRGSRASSRQQSQERQQWQAEELRQLLEEERLERAQLVANLTAAKHASAERLWAQKRFRQNVLVQPAAPPHTLAAGELRAESGGRSRTRRPGTAPGRGTPNRSRMPTRPITRGGGSMQIGLPAVHD
eukprot:SAG25_NODE_368_length_9082_cov_5.789937_9_plen_229_part_00